MANILMRWVRVWLALPQLSKMPRKSTGVSLGLTSTYQGFAF
jgi:hypothetical protein